MPACFHIVDICFHIILIIFVVHAATFLDYLFHYFIIIFLHISICLLIAQAIPAERRAADAMPRCAELSPHASSAVFPAIAFIIIAAWRSCFSFICRCF